MLFASLEYPLKHDMGANYIETKSGRATSGLSQLKQRNFVLELKDDGLGLKSKGGPKKKKFRNSAGPVRHQKDAELRTLSIIRQNFPLFCSCP